MALSEEMRLAIKLTAQDTTRQAFGSLNQSLDGLKRAAVAAAATIGSVLAFRDVIAATQKLGEEVDLLRDELGLSAQEASKWNIAARIMGLTAQDISATMGTLNRKLIEQLPLIAEGKDDFTKWGVAVKDAGGAMLAPEEVFENIRRVINDLPPGFARSGAAMDLFGRSGKQLLDFLTIGQEEMRGFLRDAKEWGLILDEQGVDAIESFNRQLRFMDLQFDAIKLAIGQFLLPFLRQLLNAFRQTAGMAKAFGEALRAPFGIIKEVIDRFGKFVAQIKDRGFVNAVASLAEDVVAKVGEALGNVQRWISEAWPKWVAALDRLWDDIVMFMETNAPRFGDWIAHTIPVWVANLGVLLQRVTTWVISDFHPAFISALLTVTQKLGEWSLAVLQWFVTEGAPTIMGGAIALGGSIARGIFDGLGSLGSRIGAWFNDNVIIPFQLKINELLAAARNLPLIGGFIPQLQIPVNQPAPKVDLTPSGAINLLPLSEQQQYLRQFFPQNFPSGGGGPDFISAQHGAIVTRPTLALTGEAGPEAIVPLGRGGGMGATVNIYVSGNVTRSEHELAEIVAGELIRAMRGSGQASGSPMSRGSFY